MMSKNAQIIKNVEGKTRTARFVCVIAYIDENAKAIHIVVKSKGKSTIRSLEATDLDMIQSSIILSMVRL